MPAFVFQFKKHAKQPYFNCYKLMVKEQRTEGGLIQKACILAKRRPNCLTGSHTNKSFSVVWIEKRDRRAKKSHTASYFRQAATQKNHIIAICAIFTFNLSKITLSVTLNQ